MNATARVEFQPMSHRASNAVLLLRAALLLAALGVLAKLMRLSLLVDFVPGSTDPAIFQPSDALVTLVTLLQGVVQLITLIAFMIWVHGSYRNLQPLNDRGPRHTPGWAVAGFFVPFLNVFRAPDVISELWVNSQAPSTLRSGAMHEPSSQRSQRSAALVGWWWALCILTALFERASSSASSGATESIGMLKISTCMGLANDALDIPRALLAIMIIQTITRWQTERHQAWSHSHAPLPDPNQYAVA